MELRDSVCKARACRRVPARHTLSVKASMNPPQTETRAPHSGTVWRNATGFLSLVNLETTSSCLKFGLSVRGPALQKARDALSP